MPFSPSGCLKESRMRLPSRPQARAWSLKGATLICSTSITAIGPPITRAGAGVPVSAPAWLPAWPWAAEAHDTDSRTAARQPINDLDRKNVVEGKRVSVREDLGGRLNHK